MFTIKKIIATLLMPLPSVLILSFIGLYLLWFTRNLKLGRTVLSFSWIFLFIFSFQPFSTSVLSSFEREYSPYTPKDEPVKYVMVLGSSHVLDSALPLSSQINSAALMRLNEGIRILRTHPSAKLLLTGYESNSGISNARMLAKMALDLGVPKTKLLLLETPKDTYEEAKRAALFIKKEPFILVTSASHMPRAIELFNKMGLSPIPAPTNFLAQTEINQFWDKYSPKPQYLMQTQLAWHETLGCLWRKIVGFVDYIEEKI